MLLFSSSLKLSVVFFLIILIFIFHSGFSSPSISHQGLCCGCQLLENYQLTEGTLPYSAALPLARRKGGKQRSLKPLCLGVSPHSQGSLMRKYSRMRHVTHSSAKWCYLQSPHKASIIPDFTGGCRNIIIQWWKWIKMSACQVESTVIALSYHLGASHVGLPALTAFARSCWGVAQGLLHLQASRAAVLWNWRRNEGQEKGRSFHSALFHLLDL